MTANAGQAMLTLLAYFLDLWMVLAPYARLTSLGHAWNNWIIGIVLVAASLVEVRRRRTIATGVAIVVGGWLEVSGFVLALHNGTTGRANDLIVGVVLLCCGAAAVKPLRSAVGHS